ncbi:hypothetical protein niasHT_022823 [Heterodera trifolii]|uniref:BTB domain-containing protein n=1 Tax=Heterodera trifolii TaxID=157864 RepID=A0ABD2KNN5_9BILA
MLKSATDWMKLLLSTGEYADVHFLVGDGDEKELVPAHKLILKHASDVFKAMFRFDSKNAKPENDSANCPVVEIPDVEAAAFKVMLSFIYAGDLSDLNGDNAMAVLYTAKKYNIPSLVRASLQIPISKLPNVFLAYAQACLFDLEDFAHDCLLFIDQNADTLLKLDEFLQIDQNLLCKIFGRAKECSAANLRAVLGPALFKIRFPLISKEEFANKIVPSGVLTTDEVIGVQQYNRQPNFDRISKPYQLQFPSQERIWTDGTLLMDIEKVSEFAGPEQKSCVFSETVLIKRLQWKIVAQIKTKNRSSYEKWLGIYLLCDAPEEDKNWRCKCSAKLKIISQKNEVHNSIGTFCEYFFDSKSTNRGFENFISYAELMDQSNGFYNREADTVTLAIDVTVKDEKTEKPFLNQSKSNGTISMEIEKLSEFAREIVGSERKSETVHIKGFPWKILAQIRKKNGRSNDEKTLYIFLLCDAPKEDKNWSCKCSATLRIVSQKNGVSDFRRELEDFVFDRKKNNLGYYAIFFAELMDPEKGFYNQGEDKVTLAMEVTVKDMI